MPPKGGLCVLGLIVAMGFAGPAPAGELPDTMERPGGFPERPLRLVVPYGSGGGSAQVSRAMAKAVTGHTGVVIEPEYVPGGSGMDGLQAYMATPADGYTVLEHIDDATSAFANVKSDVHPGRDLVPLVIAQITFSQIYIRGNETRFSDWASFVKYAKARGLRATMANVSAQGSMERLNMNRIAQHFGFRIQQISFDEPGPRYEALRSARVDALFEQPGDVKEFLDSGDFKPILTLLAERPPAFAGVPSMKDVGLAFTPLMRFRGFYVKTGVPADRLKWLQWAFHKGFEQPGFQAFNKRKFMGLIPSFRDTEGAIALIEETMDVYRKTYKEMGLIE